MGEQGPRPTIYETALDDLKLLLAIVQKHEPGSYRASGTIAALEPILTDFHRRALQTVAQVGMREGDSDFFEALRLAKGGFSASDLKRCFQIV